MNNCKHPIENRVNFHETGYHCTACSTDVPIEKPNNKPQVVYIVGRTTGVEKLNLDTFNAVEGFLHKYGYETVKQHDIFDDNAHHHLTQQDAMHMRFEVMDMCDIILLLPDWMECSYARAEQRYARTMQMDVRNYTTFCASHQLLKGKGKAGLQELKQLLNKSAAA